MMSLMLSVFRTNMLLHEGVSRRQACQKRRALVGDVLAALLFQGSAARGSGGAAPQGRRRQACSVPRAAVAVRTPRVIMFELETQDTSLDSSCGEEVDGEGEHEVDQHLGQPAERSLAVGEGEDRARAGRGGV